MLEKLETGEMQISTLTSKTTTTTTTTTNTTTTTTTTPTTLKTTERRRPIAGISPTPDGETSAEAKKPQTRQWL